MSFMFSGGLIAHFSRAPEHFQSLVYKAVDSSSTAVAAPLQLYGPTVAILALSAFTTIRGQLTASKSEKESTSQGTSIAMHVTSFASALVFGLGLGVSGMCNPQRVLKFLDFSNPVTGWDPTLACVMGAGVAVTATAFHYLKNTKQKTLLNEEVCLDCTLKMGMCKENTLIDWKLIVGSLMFGAGMCIDVYL